jgi:hypothetical protein
MVAVVRLTSPIAWRRVAYNLARLAQRAEGYDFPSFPPPAGRARDDQEHTRAFLYCEGPTAVGYLVAADQPTGARWDFTQEEVPPGPDHQVRPTVGLAFTCFHWRRQGIASALVRAVAQHANVPTSGLAWDTPFTEEGEALARTFAGDDGRVWIT